MVIFCPDSVRTEKQMPGVRGKGGREKMRIYRIQKIHKIFFMFILFLKLSIFRVFSLQYLRITYFSPNQNH